MARIRRLFLAATVLVAILAPIQPAAACYGEPCDAISDTCYTVQPLVPKYDLHCGLG